MSYYRDAALLDNGPTNVSVGSGDATTTTTTTGSSPPPPPQQQQAHRSISLSSLPHSVPRCRFGVAGAVQRVLSVLRTLVSGDKRRTRLDENIDLDLSYITDRIIGMGFPGAGIESLWRNDISDVAMFLEVNHPSHFKIFNLSERKYDYGMFNNQVVDCGFPDHHNPPIKFLFEICECMHAFLEQDERNVAIVHCMAGRGRTGTVIASYLTYNGQFDNGTDALDFFASRRSHNEVGVSNPSQRRYVQYFSEILHGREPTTDPMYLKSITFYLIPSHLSLSNTFQPYVEIFRYVEDVQQPEPGSMEHPCDHPSAIAAASSCTLRARSVRKNFICSGFADTPVNVADGTAVITFPGCALQGDIYLRCYHLKSCPSSTRRHTFQHRAPLKGARKTYLFRASFHTGFVNSDLLRFTKAELDDGCKRLLLDKDFFMDLQFTRHLNPQSRNSTSSSSAHHLQSSNFPSSMSTSASAPASNNNNNNNMNNINNNNANNPTTPPTPISKLVPRHFRQPSNALSSSVRSTSSSTRAVGDDDEDFEQGPSSMSGNLYRDFFRPESQHDTDDDDDDDDDEEGDEEDGEDDDDDDDRNGGRGNDGSSGLERGGNGSVRKDQVVVDIAGMGRRGNSLRSGSSAHSSRNRIRRQKNSVY